ncbi:MAG: biopolymer transporter ExbD [Synechococcaceae cyanobacterium SM1_2_3]|nr:biopolymer transporter ExbD [Synechococcaceae cyanobacterium SM1_2_3]
MLVLLVIFMITLPLIASRLTVQLPETDAQPTVQESTAVELAIDAQGQLFWDGIAVSDAELEMRLQAAARRRPKPDLHLRADKTTPYQRLAEVMSAAQRNELNRIGFITAPKTP